MHKPCQCSDVYAFLLCYVTSEEESDLPTARRCWGLCDEDEPSRCQAARAPPPPPLQRDGTSRSGPCRTCQTMSKRLGRNQLASLVTRGFPSRHTLSSSSSSNAAASLSWDSNGHERWQETYADSLVQDTCLMQIMHIGIEARDAIKASLRREWK